jgi:hypothetical protein
MEQLQEQVWHRRFGIGSIMDQTEKIITIKFSEDYGIKMFEYPLAFETYLTFCNTGLQEKIQTEIGLVKEQIETERRHKEEEYQKRKEETMGNKLAAKQTSSLKRSPVRKPAKKVSSKAKKEELASNDAEKVKLASRAIAK